MTVTVGKAAVLRELCAPSPAPWFDALRQRVLAGTDRTVLVEGTPDDDWGGFDAEVLKRIYPSSDYPLWFQSVGGCAEVMTRFAGIVTRHDEYDIGEQTFAIVDSDAHAGRDHAAEMDQQIGANHPLRLHFHCWEYDCLESHFLEPAPLAALWRQQESEVVRPEPDWASLIATAAGSPFTGCDLEAIRRCADGKAVFQRVRGGGATAHHKTVPLLLANLLRTMRDAAMDRVVVDGIVGRR